MYPPPPPYRPQARRRHGMPAFGVILVGVGCLMAGCIGGAAIASTPAPETTTSAVASPASASASPTRSGSRGSVNDDRRKTHPKRTTAKPKPHRATRAPSPDRRYSSCAKANRAGHGPYVRGVDPEYRWYEDRDGDGRVCERR